MHSIINSSTGELSQGTNLVHVSNKILDSLPRIATHLLLSDPWERIKECGFNKVLPPKSVIFMWIVRNRGQGIIRENCFITDITKVFREFNYFCNLSELVYLTIILVLLHIHVKYLFLDIIKDINSQNRNPINGKKLWWIQLVKN